MAFRVELRNALSAELLTELQQEGPCLVGVVQSHLATMLRDDARPVLVLQGSPLTSMDVLREDVSLEVVRQTVTEAAANSLQEARTAVGELSAGDIEEITALIVPPRPLLHVLSAVLTVMGRKEPSWESVQEFLRGSEKLAGRASSPFSRWRRNTPTFSSTRKSIDAPWRFGVKKDLKK
eukprot:s700_g4.t3